MGRGRVRRERERRDSPILQLCHSVHGGYSIEPGQCEPDEANGSEANTAQRHIGSTVAAVSTEVFTCGERERERERERKCVALNDIMCCVIMQECMH